jgi:hypothetical protein
MGDTQSTEPGGPAVNIVLDADCRDLFVDGVGGTMVRDGVFRLNLVNTRYNFPGAAVEHAVVTRLIMSRSGAQPANRALAACLQDASGRQHRDRRRLGDAGS